MITVVMFKRDFNGNKTNKRVTFKSTDSKWIGDRVERELNKRPKKAK